jgi:hypothetical protein
MSGPTHAEICAKGGRSRSDRKVAAVKRNLQKAKAALKAGARPEPTADDYGAPGATGPTRPSGIHLQ